MDRRLAVLVFLGVLGVAAIVRFLTQVLEPLYGYALGLLIYDLLLLLPLCMKKLSVGGIRSALKFQPIDLVAGLVLLVPPLGIASVVIFSGVFATLPMILILAVLGIALVNGTMEELFWRHALLDDTSNKVAMVLAVVFFGAWHLALLAAKGITLEGGPPALIGGALFLGAIWMWARIRTGKPLLGIYSHIAMNFFAFSQLASQNLPGG